MRVPVPRTPAARPHPGLSAAAARPRGPGPAAPRGARRDCPPRPGPSPATTRPRAGGYTPHPRRRSHRSSAARTPPPGYSQPRRHKFGGIGGTDSAQRVGAIRQRRGIQGHQERKGRHHADVLPAQALRGGGPGARGGGRTGTGQTRTAIGGLEHAIEARLGRGHPEFVEGGKHTRLREGEPALAGSVEDPGRQRQLRERRAHLVNEAVLIRVRVRQTERDRAAEGGPATGQRERHQGTDRDARQGRRGGRGRDALEAQGVRRGQRRRRELAHDPVGGDDVVGLARRHPLRLAARRSPPDRGCPPRRHWQ